MANRRITEFPAIAANDIVDQDVMTLVHVFEVDPTLRNKKITFSGFKDYLDVYYVTNSGAVISGNVTITGNLTVGGNASFNTVAASGLGTFSGIIVQNNATISGIISGDTLTGTYLQGGLLNAGTGTFNTLATGTTASFSTGNFTSLTGTTTSGVSTFFTNATFTNVTGVTFTGTTVAATTGTFQTLSTPVLNISGNLSVASGLTVTGTAQFTSGVQVTGTLSGTTVTGTAARFTTVTGVTGVFTTTLSGATITGTAVRATSITGATGTFTTRVSGAIVTGNTGSFGSVSGISGVFTQFLSGAVITGDTGRFTAITGVSGVFTNLSGATVTGDFVNATHITGASGVFTSRISGTTLTGNTGQFTTITGATIVGTTSVSGGTVTGNTGQFTTITGVTVIGTTSVSGTTVTGNTVLATNLTGQVGTFTTSVSGALITGDTVLSTSGRFQNISGLVITGDTVQAGTLSAVSGVFANIVFTNTVVSGNLSVLGTGIFSTGGIVSSGTISGATVISPSGIFTFLSGTTVTGTTGTFTSLTGTTTTGTNANFATGTFSTRVSGLTVVGTTGTFSTRVSGLTVVGTTGTFTLLTGTTTTGVTATFTTLSGVTVTGATASFTSGVFAAGSATNPSISFTSDPNTGIYSPDADQVAFTASGTEGIRVKTTELVINETGTNYDFRIEGDNKTNLVFVDASTDRVGINTSTPSDLVHIYDTIGTTSLRLSNNSGGPQNSNQIFFESQLFNKTASITHSANSFSNSLQIGGVTDLTYDSDSHLFRSASGTNRLYIDSFGSLYLVGTSGNSLSIDGAASANRFTASGGNIGIGIQATNGVPVYIVSSTGPSIAMGANNPGYFGLVYGTQYSADEHFFLYSSLGVHYYQMLVTGPNYVPENVFNNNGANIDFRIAGDNNSNLFFADASTDRIGIGTSAPGALLHLSSATGSASPTPTELRIATLTVGSDWSVTDPWGRISFYNADGSGSGPKIHAAIDATALTSAGGTSDLVFRTNNNLSNTLEARMVIKGDSSAAGARVGIGVTSPGGTLDIKAAATLTPLIVQGPSSEFARIDSSGRLLVGTSSAFGGAAVTSQVQVLGTDTSTSSLSLTRTSDNTGSPFFVFIKSRGADSSAINTVVQANDAYGGIKFAGADGTDRNSIGASIDAFVDGTPGLDDMPGRLVFSTTADGASSPTERLRITSAGLVGIGTSAPDSTLNVRAGANNTAAEEIASFSRPDASVRAAISKGLISGTTNGIALGTTTNHPFALNTNGAERLYITNAGNVGIGTTSPGGTLDIKAAASTAPLIVQGPSSEFARIDSSGRLLIGSTLARANFSNSTLTPQLQVEATTTSSSSIALIANGSASGSNPIPIVLLGRSRGTFGTNVLVSSGDALGSLSFQGNDGSEFVDAAYIRAFVDGTAAADVMPGRLAFFTTADGASSPTERLRITNDGVMCYDQAAPVSYAAAATLVIGDLKNGLIQYTGGAATLTLPTGTLTEGGFSGVYINMTFEWSVINTGSGTCTIGNGTGHTVTGSATVAAGASGRFASRRTAANTFVSYRLS